MLKKAVINIASSVGYIASFLLTKKLFWFFDLVKNAIYSGWIKSSLKKVGENFSVQYPMNHVGLKFISIDNNFSCFSRLRLEAFDKHLDNSYTPIVNIGANVSINFDCHIACINNIEIGNNVLIASKVFITDHSHGEINTLALETPPSARKVVSKGPVIIEDNVWIGEGVAILSNVTIGKNSIIGANAVVTKSFPENSLIGGNPAKLIKTIE
ncbi:DapH/DapD/GlmU-related protein [Mucilaginibacter sp. RCC_168]|jgi:acetyltransferase-like isoleucine patch superfamily enzyme|uniref:DapH/DapD/GlmU-related protein n=1 Tax=unclassified Mucilaginibacter TaxID=2617802 RepID=UPI0035233869